MKLKRRNNGQIIDQAKSEAKEVASSVGYRLNGIVLIVSLVAEALSWSTQVIKVRSEPAKRDRRFVMSEEWFEIDFV